MRLIVFRQVNGVKRSSLKSVFKNVNTVQLCSESTDLLKMKLSQPRAWKHGGIVPLAVVRPVNEKSTTWPDEVVGALKGVAIIVTTSVAPSGLACWMTKQTLRLPIVEEE